MNIPTERYLDQKAKWPATGRHILASFDEETIVVYQAYSPTIGNYAAAHGHFGGAFSYSRMSWIKPNFLWMMYRSNWGQAVDQEVVLAIRLRRTFFETLLGRAVPSSYLANLFATEAVWKSAVQNSDVRLQWDPDHRPNGSSEERRAIQLGLRGASLDAYGKREIVEIVDLSQFVASQRDHVTKARLEQLIIPSERPYHLKDEGLTQRIGLDPL